MLEQMQENQVSRVSTLMMSRNNDDPDFSRMDDLSRNHNMKRFKDSMLVM